MNRPKSSYEDIRQGLEEFIHNPDALTRYEYPEPDVRAIREGMDLSQAQFAALMAVSVRTLQNWEQGHRSPTGAARTLLRVMQVRPGAVLESVHPRAVKSSKRRAGGGRQQSA
ncbi:MAG: helix-turn-helix domain-containing protein [Chromatiales bacterium]|nr:MAG: helix-turn-helix domain-containing protein [Chromatiales bacterium]